MGLAGNRRTASLLDRVLAHDAEKALREFHALWMDGKDPAVLLTELNGLLRDTLMMKLAPRGGASLISGGYDSATLLALEKRMTQEELLCAMETLQRALGTMRVSSDPRTTAELCLVSLCDNTLGESVGELRARISRLEEQAKCGAVFTAAPAEREEEELPPPPEDEYPEPPMPEPEPEPEPEPDPQPAREAAPAETELRWESLRDGLASALPREIAPFLDDEQSIRGSVENGVLTLEVLPGFLYGRVNRPEVLSKIGEAATGLAGREIRAAVRELSDEPAAPRRSLDELRGFKEVHFN